MANPAGQLRVGVVGGGIRGQMYAAVVREHPDAELAGVVETSPRVAERLADLQVPVVNSVDDLLAATTVDALIIATPDFAHLEPGRAALNAGLPILIEKPLATSMDEALALREAAGDNCKVLVGFENRWNPKFQTLKASLQRSGAPMIAQRALLSDTTFVPRQMLSWAAKSTPGWFLMPHSLDLALWLSGARPVEVYAKGVKSMLVEEGIDTWDRISAIVTLSDGSLVTLDSGWVLPTGRPAVFEFRYEIETTADHLEVEIDRSGITQFTDAGASFVGGAAVDHRGRLQGAPIEMTRDFIDWCRGAELDLPGIEDGLIVTATIEALHRCLETGVPQRVSID